MPRLLFAFLFLIPGLAHAYPEFIGYKYASCLSCHFNGQGNGPLNDYGRALWASEIAGRWMANGRTDEQLGEASGFLGKKPMPWWLRPGIKARYIGIRDNPGAPGKWRYIWMQLEGNLAVFFDQDQKYALVGSYGYAPVPAAKQGTANAGQIDQWISREHYLRVHATENWWLYLGMTDKVYGIRQVNHTAFSRSRTGLAQNDQAHGLVAHYIQPEYEFTVNAFAGNLYQAADKRQTGASVMYEWDIAEAWRLGASALVSTNKFIGNRRFGVHSKKGLGHGSAILFETGLIQDLPKGSTERKGYYVFSELMQKVTRGYHLFFTGEFYKDDMSAGRSDLFIGRVGLLAFPMQRFEYRVEARNSMAFNEDTSVSEDGWSLWAQIHLSL